MSKIYGYVRVSSRDQNEDRQLIAMREMMVKEKNIFIDKQSGKDFNRPEYKRMIKRLRENDLIYIKSIDRLGRNYEDILEQWKIITKEKRADICVLDMPILDTRRGKDLLGTLISDIILSLLSYFSEAERKNIRQRQAEGISAAKAKGIKFGRVPKPLPENFQMVLQKWNRGEITLDEAAKETGMVRSTFYYRARRRESDYNDGESSNC